MFVPRGDIPGTAALWLSEFATTWPESGSVMGRAHERPCSIGEGPRIDKPDSLQPGSQNAGTHGLAGRGLQPVKS